MARTFRRKQKEIAANDRFWWCSALVKVGASYQWIPFAINSAAYKKGAARYHSDAGTYAKDPGPSWFRNLTAQRPHRYDAQRQIKKYMRDPQYEVIVRHKPKLEYYT